MAGFLDDVLTDDIPTTSPKSGKDNKPKSYFGDLLSDASPTTSLLTILPQETAGSSPASPSLIEKQPGRENLVDRILNLLSLSERLSISKVVAPALSKVVPSKAEQLKTASTGQDLSQIFIPPKVETFETQVPIDVPEGFNIAGSQATAKIPPTTTQKVTAEKPARTVARTAAGFGASVLLDPLSYVGVGELTKAGEAARLIRGARGINLMKGAVVRLERKAAESGLSKVEQEALKNAKNLIAKGTELGKEGISLAPTVAEQIGKKQRSLVSFAGVPIVTGKPGEAVVKGLETVKMGAKSIPGVKTLEKAFVPYAGLKEKYPEVEDLIRSTKDKNNALRATAVERGKELVAKVPNLEERQALTKILELPEELPPQFPSMGSIPTNVGKIDSEEVLKIIKPSVKTVEEPGLFLDIGNKRGIGDKRGRLLPTEDRYNINFKKRNIETEIPIPGSETIETKLKVKPGSPVDIPVDFLEEQKSVLFKAQERVLAKEGLTNEGREALEILEKVRAKRTRKLLKEGVFDDEAKLLPEYVRHIKPAEEGTTQGIVPFFNSLYSKAKSKFTKKRKIEGTIEEINKKYGENFFLSDAAVLNAISDVEVGEVLNTTHLFKKISSNPAWVKPAKQIKQFGSTVDMAEDGFELINHPLFKGKQVPKEIAEELKNVLPKLGGDEATNAFLRTYDGIQNWWKSWTLSIFPAYHSRNMVGNVWNNFLKDVDPKSYLYAAQIQREINPSFFKDVPKSPTKNLVTSRGDMVSFQRMHDEAKELGVLKGGFYGSDIDSAIRTDLASGTILPTKRNYLLRYGMAVGGTIEDNARLAHFIDRRLKGFTPQEAAKSTKATLFDYTDLTPFERDVMKRIFPFYTWTRKNIPVQIENMITKPGKTALIGKARRSIEQGQEPVTEDEAFFIPDYIKKHSNIRVRRNENGDWEYFILDSWLPTADINRLGAPLESVAQMSTPLAKSLVEWWTNYNTFFKKEIERFPGEREKFLGIEMRKKAINTLKNIRLLKTIDDLSDEDTPLQTRLTNLSVGKLTAVNEEKSRQYKMYEINQLARGMEFALQKASREERDSEIERLRQQLQGLSPFLDEGE